MIDVCLVRVFERKQLRSTVIDRQHVDRERAFHRGVFVKIVDNDLRIRVALQFDHYSRVLIRFVSDCRDLT